MALQAVASCNRFTAEQEVERTQSTLQLWEPHIECYGPIVALATDGNTRCGNAMRTMSKELEDAPGMPLLQWLVTIDGATFSKDQRHITKRLVRLLVSGKGITIDGVSITASLLVRLSRVLGVAPALAQALKEAGFMLVPSVLLVVEGVCAIGQPSEGGYAD